MSLKMMDVRVQWFFSYCRRNKVSWEWRKKRNPSAAGDYRIFNDVMYRGKEWVVLLQNPPTLFPLLSPFIRNSFPNMLSSRCTNLINSHRNPRERNLHILHQNWVFSRPAFYSITKGTKFWVHIINSSRFMLNRITPRNRYLGLYCLSYDLIMLNMDGELHCM